MAELSSSRVVRSTRVPIWYVRVATRGGKGRSEVVLSHFKLDDGPHLFWHPWKYVMDLVRKDADVANFLNNAPAGEHLQVRRQIRFPGKRWRDRKSLPAGGCEYVVTDQYSDGERVIKRVPLDERQW